MQIREGLLTWRQHSAADLDLYLEHGQAQLEDVHGQEHADTEEAVAHGGQCDDDAEHGAAGRATRRWALDTHAELLEVAVDAQAALGHQTTKKSNRNSS